MKYTIDILRFPQKRHLDEEECLLQDKYTWEYLTPIDGRAAAAFEEVPKPFFSILGALTSPKITGTNRTPLKRRSVRNLAACCILELTVSFFPARMT